MSRDRRVVLGRFPSDDDDRRRGRLKPISLVLNVLLHIIKKSGPGDMSRLAYYGKETMSAERCSPTNR